MPTIKVPEDFRAELEEGEGELPPLSFVSGFMIRTLLRNHQYWGANTERLFACMEIRSAFKGKKPGDEVEITEDQWNKLVEAVKNPNDPYNVAVMVHGKSFFDAILKPHAT